MTQRCHDAHVALREGLGEVAGAFPHGEGGVPGRVVSGDQPLLALVQVDGALVDGPVCGRRIQLADHATGGVLDHLDRPAVGRPQVDGVNGPVGPGPEPSRRAASEMPGRGQAVQQRGQCDAEVPRVVKGHREFLRCGGDVGGQHMRVLRVQDGALHGAVEDQLRVFTQVGVQRIRSGDQDRERVPARAPCSSCLLPQPREGAGEAARHDGVDPRDVDAELEGIGAGDPLELAALQPGFQPASVVGEVAAPIGGHQARRQFPLRPQRDELCLHPRGGERQRLPPVADEPGQQVGSLVVRVVLRLPQQEVQGWARRGVGGDLDNLRHPSQLLQQGPGVGDRRGGRDEDGVGPVVVRQPTEPA